MYPPMAQAQEVAEDMARRFQAKHFLIETVLDYITPDVQHWIEAREYQPVRVGMGKPSMSIFNPDKVYTQESKLYNFTVRADEIPVAIQKVRRAPSPALFFGTYPFNRDVYARERPAFLPHIPNRPAFARQLDQEIERMALVLDAHPHLEHDLQLLLDGQGWVYHIDLDGHIKFRGHPRPRQKKIDHVLHKLQELREMVVPTTTLPKNINTTKVNNQTISSR
jgi:hypothetical protein